MSPDALPVDAVVPALVRGVREAGGAVLRAPTGAGKTTRVPPALLSAADDRLVLLLEPRRIAARAAARRIAAEQGVRLGAEIGYQVRFDRRASPATRLLVVTEGILLAMLQDDPWLERVRLILFDEFHERSLASDLALALVQRIRSTARSDLGVVVMSATLDPEPIARFLGDVPVFASEGRTFPVQIEHHPPSADASLERSVRSAVLAALPRSEGDVLVFLPGVGEIRRCAKDLRGPAAAHDLEVCELHGELPPERQDAVLAGQGRRKVVLATNVAETSLTIPRVRIVIDVGLERVPRVDPATGLERLETVRIARTSGDQRTGRAGRTSPGLCLRLWSRSEDARLAPRREPAIGRSDLAEAALQLHAWGEADLGVFPWFEPPPRVAIEMAEALLMRLGALQAGRITPIGRAMARVPAHPRLARMLVEARTCGHGERVALAAAALSDRSPFVPLPRDGEAPHTSASDVLDVVEALEAYGRTRRLTGGVRPLRRGPAQQALRVARQLARWIGTTSARGDADEAVLRAVLAAYPDRIARRRTPASDRARMVGGHGVRLGRESAVRAATLFACVDVAAGRRGERAEGLVRRASAIERAWLPTARIHEAEEVAFDAQREAVVGTRRTSYEDLVLEEVALQVPRGQEVERVLVEAASTRLPRALPLENDDIAALRTRVACLRAWRPELELPALDDDALRDLLPALARGCRSFAELRRAPLADHLRGRFAWSDWQRLETEAPTHLEVPSGSHIRLKYEAGRPPILAVRIQEVFGLRETPTLAGGRVKVLLHLLAPNHRPQQITDDMPSFWATTYPQVRAELRARYPRHAWPEDPLAASAERKPRKRR